MSAWEVDGQKGHVFGIWAQELLIVPAAKKKGGSGNLPSLKIIRFNPTNREVKNQISDFFLGIAIKLKRFSR